MFIDIVFLLLMLFACVKGYSKGLIVALFSMVGFITGLAAALKFSVLAAEKLTGTFNTSGKWLPFISFLLVFIVVVILVNIGGKLVQKSVEMVLLGWANRIAGIVLYALLYCIFLSVFLFYAVQLHFISVETTSTSLIYSFIKPIGPMVINAMGTLIPWFKDVFSQLEDFFEILSHSPELK